ncbi:phytanoyl-CoA dioxygenase family protein [Hymenobacter coccineus]|uniref:Phytanoyl-CoA dioxygenase n=1 Tax=Hymenobacter coccineus TaxID=1908235 RepID=A0A1G1TLZ4_9BACT|nr:phytanoyl-CoA dioxygenase family protein [Hymenobacter coccineus]OGX91893.1 phytanoyl-CoA dioxygenase [Hymenobacter coccineus]
MLSFVRRLKLSYAVYNIFQRSRLLHNVPVYKRLGLNKRYFSPVSSRDFAHLPVPDASTGPALAQRLAACPAFGALGAAGQASLLSFDDDGFAVLPGFFSAELVDGINADLAQLIARKQIGLRYGNKFMFAFRQSARIRHAGEASGLRDLISALLGHEAQLFQSINFLRGSEQRTHSDSIHMSTYPLGGLAAAWVALEDITPGNGPLHYYPGSHALPYYLNADYQNEGTAWLIGDKNYAAYERFIEGRVAALGLQKEVFLAKKGDVFIWHANLLHGGDPHRDDAMTRRSMVFHYFSPAHVCYHEITQRPALL